MRASSSWADMADRSCPNTVSGFGFLGMSSSRSIAMACSFARMGNLGIRSGRGKKALAMTLPKKMIAIRAEGEKGAVRLVTAKVPVPSPGPGQVLFKVATGGVNRADLLQ